MEKDLRKEVEAQAGAGGYARRRTISGEQLEENDLIDDCQNSASLKSIPANEQSSVTSIEGLTGNGAPKQAPPAEPEALRTKLQTAIIMSSLCASVFLAALDITIITNARPVISEHFHSNAGYTWIGSAYLLANAASTPSWAKFSDIWGRKPILLIAVAVFFLGSLVAATSINIGMLITARAIQGVGGGGLIILVNICISDLFSMRNRGKYFGIAGMVWALASSIGPVLGGVLTEKTQRQLAIHYSRNKTDMHIVPIIGVVFILLCIFLHLDNPKTPVWDGLKAVDWAGSLTIVVGTLMLLLGLEFGGVTFSWASTKVICLIIFGIFFIGLFVINEWKFARYPIMQLRLFKHRSNIAALGVCFCHGYVFIAGTYYLPLYFQAVLGATPLLSGVYLLPFALSLSFVSGATGVFIKKTGQYLPPIWFGLTVMCLGFGLFIGLGSTANWTKIILFQIVAGIGAGPNFQSPLIALQSMVAPRDISTATATFGFTRNLSTSISVVIGSVVFENQIQKRYPLLVAALGRSTANKLSGSSAEASVGIIAQLPPVQRAIARDAFFQSLRTMWIMYVAFAGLGLFVSLFVGNQKLSEEHQVTKTGLAEEEAKRKDLQEKKRQPKEMLLDGKRAWKEGLKKGDEQESREKIPKEQV